MPIRRPTTRRLTAEPPTRRRRARSFVLRGGAVLLGVFLLMQLVPYGWRHSNPPVVRDAPWPDEASAAIARRSCYSCHSNETDWPAYSYVAPMSWLVRRDVDRGRAALNFSEWDPEDDEADDAIELIEDGAMPPSQYTMVHRDARLSAEEERILITALAQLSDDDDEPGGDEVDDEPGAPDDDDGGQGRGRGRGRGRGGDGPGGGDSGG